MTQEIDINGRFLLQPVTGVQRVAREVLSQFNLMARAGYIPQPRVLLPSHGEIVDLPDLPFVRFQRVGYLRGHAWEQIELPFYSGKSPLLCLGNLAPLVRLYQSSRPTITMVHDLSYLYFPDAYDWKFKTLYGRIIPSVLRRSKRVITVSQSEKTSIEAHFPSLKGSERISFLQNGGIPDHLSLEAATAKLPDLKHRNYGLYVGSLTKRKNADGVIKAAVEFLRLYPNMKFVIIGATASSFENVDLSLPTDLVDRIEFRGQINDPNQIFEAYRNARFLLFPSFYEASPLPPIEAMTFGCPVVSSDIPSLTERCGDAAIYCKPTDPKSILNATKVLMDDRTWHQWSETSRVHAARYSWASQADGLVQLTRSA